MSAPLSVLVVEDNPDCADSTAELLTMCGHAVRVAHTVAEATAAVAESVPDVVLLNVGLPDGSGLDLAPAFVALRPRPLLVVVTGFSGLELRSRAAGADHYLLKPFAPARLIDLLWEYAARRTEPG